MINDVVDVCKRPKIQRLIRQSDKWVDGLVADFRRFADIVTPVSVRGVADDPDDDVLLGTAVAGNADYFVTGNDHFLRTGQCQDIRIVTPRQFLTIIEQSRTWRTVRLQ